MIVFDTETILLATIGSIGILASLTVLSYGFVRSPRGCA